MTPKTIVITGGTSGIGRAAAEALAQHGHRVTILGRSQRRADDTLAAIAAAPEPGTAHFIQTELATVAGMNAAATAVAEVCQKIDVLMNNAAAIHFRRRVTEDGYEWTFALNHLAPFVLTHRLLPNLAESEAARIITTSSSSHYSGKIEFDNLHLSHGYNAMRAYSQSKLGNVLFTRELARRLESTSIEAFAFHPGLVATNLARQNPLLRPILGLGYWLFARSPKEGARTAVYLAESPEVSGRSGEFFIDEQSTRMAKAAYDDELALALWQRSAELAGLPPALPLGR